MVLLGAMKRDAGRSRGESEDKYLHCLNEQRYETLDLEKHLRIGDIVKRLRGEVNCSLAHRIPQLLHLHERKV